MVFWAGCFTTALPTIPLLASSHLAIGFLCNIRGKEGGTWKRESLRTLLGVDWTTLLSSATKLPSHFTLGTYI